MLFTFVTVSYPQALKLIEKRNGIVSYLSAQHVYVKFDNTDSISVGDTLFYSNGTKDQPALIIKFISSKSCAGEKILNTKLKIDDKLFVKVPIQKSITVQTNRTKEIQKQSSQSMVSAGSIPPRQYFRKNYWGKLSMQSLSSYSNTPSNDSQRWRYSFSFNSDSINGTGLSFSSYLFFAYNTKDWSDIKKSIGKALKIYDLSLGYNFSNKSRFWLGRYLNPKIANVGSIDGVQYQQNLGKYYLGAVIGSHPDFSDYGYNLKMFEYGGYFGRIDTIASSQMENTIAFMNQTNNFKTDRRYLYFQHSNNLVANTSLFASSEFDLYKIENGLAKNDLSLTSVFISLYYTPARLLSVSLSFDARRNAIYYETFKTYLENLLTNELRKGYRLSLYLRPLNNLSIALNGGYSFQNGDPKPAKNFGANLYYNNIPLIDFSGNLTYSKLISSYTNGTISGVTLSKYLSSVDINFSLDYRNVKYEFGRGLDPMVQHIAASEISVRLPSDIYFGLSYEGVFEKLNTYGRFFIDLTKRF